MEDNFISSLSISMVHLIWVSQFLTDLSCTDIIVLLFQLRNKLDLAWGFLENLFGCWIVKCYWIPLTTEGKSIVVNLLDIQPFLIQSYIISEFQCIFFIHEVKCEKNHKIKLSEILICRLCKPLNKTINLKIKMFWVLPLNIQVNNSILVYLNI